MKNSIFYSQSIFELNFLQVLYWKRAYVYFFYYDHLQLFYYLRFTFKNFFNFFWIFQLLEVHNSVSFNRYVNLFNFFTELREEPDFQNLSLDNSLSLILVDFYCAVLISKGNLFFFKKRYINYTSIDLSKLRLLFELMPKVKIKGLSVYQIKTFENLLRSNCVKKNKLRYYKRLTRVLKRNIHK